MTQMNLAGKRVGKRAARHQRRFRMHSHGRTGEEADLAHAAKVAQVREEPHDQGDPDGPDNSRLGSAANRLDGGRTGDAVQACDRRKPSSACRLLLAPSAHILTHDEPVVEREADEAAQACANESAGGGTRLRRRF